MSTKLEDIDLLEEAEFAAMEARRRWLLRARTGERAGKQIPPSDPRWHILLFLAGRGFGKLLDVETPVPTPTGWTTMGDLQVGDQVFDESGRVCRVTWASAPQTPLEAYRVRFSDGTHLDACADHQWVTWTHRERKAFLRSPYEDSTRFPDEWPAWRVRRSCGGAAPKVYPDSLGPRVRTTAEIVKSLTCGKRRDANHCIPHTRALQLPDIALPIDPYILGAWLGDGHATGAGFTCHESEMAYWREQFQAAGYGTSPSASDPQHLGIRGLAKQLRAAGLFKEKRVPAAYLRSSAAQRMALLRGLMDTDGGVDSANWCSFTNTQQGLVEAVAELAVSLGMRVSYDDRIPICTTTGRPGARAYRVGFTPHVQVFQLPRKQNLLNFGGAQSLRRHHRMIVKAERLSPGAAMRCITVDSRHSTYLAGRAMIPTHNTESLAQFAWWEAYRVDGIIGHWVGPTNGDVEGVGFLGPSGLRSMVPAECLWGGSWERAYRGSKKPITLTFANRSIIKGFSATEEAGRLRGPQCHFLCGDELREWDKPKGSLGIALDNALLGLRLPYPDATPARALLATTPKPIPALKRLAKRPGVRVVRGSTKENLANLSPMFRAQILAMEGTAMGRQEIEGAFIDEESDQSVIRREWIRIWPASRKLPQFHFVVESYDTASSEEDYDRKTGETDPTACQVWGVFNLNEAFPDAKLRAKLKIRGKYGVMLLEAWSERLGMPELLDKARQQHRHRWGTGQPRRADVVLIENKSSGPSLRQLLSRWGVPVWPMNPRLDKLQRLHAVAPIAAQHAIWVPESMREDRAGQPRDWVEPVLDEICAFYGEGTTEHDDHVDSFSQAFTYLIARGLLLAEPAQEYLDSEEKRDAEIALALRQQAEERRGDPRNPYGV